MLHMIAASMAHHRDNLDKGVPPDLVASDALHRLTELQSGEINVAQKNIDRAVIQGVVEMGRVTTDRNMA